MRTFIRRTSTVALSAMALALLAPASVHAQGGAGPRWLGWLGCWSAAPADRPAETGPDAPRTVCITPTRDLDVVDVSAIAEGKIVSRDKIDASGRPQTIDGNGCRGTQTARWSGDGRRVFLKSSVTCDGIATEMSALLAMTKQGTWLDIRHVAAGEGSDVRVARYRDVGIPSSVPVEISSALNTRGNFVTTDARIEAGMPVGPNAMIEASRVLNAAVVEAFVMESGQRFAVDARTLTEMADAGVPARVTDAMISVTNAADVADRGPSKVYYYSPYGWNTYGGDYGHYGRGSADAWNQGTTSRVTVNVYTYDPWGFGFWPYGGYRFGYAPFGYGLRYGRGQFFGVGFGYPYFFGYGNSPRNRVGYYYPPVIVLHNDPYNTAPRGRSVKGEGYTPDIRHAGTTQPREARPRTDGVAGAIVEAVRTARPSEQRPERRSEPAPERRAEPVRERTAQPRTEARSEPRSESRSSSNSAPRTARGRP
jgi:hypothetical protein